MGFHETIDDFSSPASVYSGFRRLHKDTCRALALPADPSSNSGVQTSSYEKALKAYLRSLHSQLNNRVLLSDCNIINQ